LKIPTLEMRERQRRLSDAAMAKLRASHEPRRRKKRQTPKRKSGLPRPIVVTPPKQLRFHGDLNDRRAFSDFINRVEEVLSIGCVALINLRELDRLYPCGLLLFMGNVRSWRDQFPGKVIGNYPGNEVVEQMLQSVGILEKLGLENRISEISHTEVTKWRYYTGTEADAQEMAPFMDEIRALIGADNQSMLYDSVVEAMTNVRQHAYAGGESTKWWMFATISQSGIMVAVYDRGASIPGTLLRKPGFTEYFTKLRAGRKKKDAWLIRLAAFGHSSTKLAYRGKGLPEMLESTRAMVGSSLGIYSRGGFFRCEGEPAHETCYRLDYPILGTLVLWRIKLPEVVV
jgi:hypothetical protein